MNMLRRATYASPGELNIPATEKELAFVAQHRKNDDLPVHPKYPNPNVNTRATPRSSWLTSKQKKQAVGPFLPCLGMDMETQGKITFVAERPPVVGITVTNTTGTCLDWKTQSPISRPPTRPQDANVPTHPRQKPYTEKPYTDNTVLWKQAHQSPFEPPRNVTHNRHLVVQNPAHNVPVRSNDSKGLIATPCFQCDCCFEDVSQRELYLWKCDGLGINQHRICSRCAKRFLWSCFETGGLSRLSVTQQKNCRFPCLSPTDCDGMIHVSLPILFESNQRAIDLFTTASTTQAVSKNGRAGGTPRLVLEDPNNTTIRPDEPSIGITRDPKLDPLQDGVRLIRQCLVEQMTNARLRRCPNCRLPFVKNEDGCNKMRCPGCLTACCYCCLRPVKDYEHFANYKGMDKSSLRLCPLWTSDAIDQQRDEQRLQETIFTVANQVWEEYLIKK